MFTCTDMALVDLIDALAYVAPFWVSTPNILAIWGVSEGPPNLVLQTEFTNRVRV